MLLFICAVTGVIPPASWLSERGTRRTRCTVMAAIVSVGCAR